MLKPGETPSNQASHQALQHSEISQHMVNKDKIQIIGTGVQPHRNRKYITLNNAHDCN